MIEKDIFIPKRTPSLNDWKGRHWRTYYQKYKKTWLQDLGWFLHKRARVDRFRYMELISYQESRGFYDRDNHAGGCKPVLDAIKSLGWIFDDSEKWVYCLYDQRKVGEEGIIEMGTRFIFYDLEFPVGSLSFPLCGKCLDNFLGVRYPFQENGVKCVLCGNPAIVTLKVGR